MSVGLLIRCTGVKAESEENKADLYVISADHGTSILALLLNWFRSAGSA